MNLYLDIDGVLLDYATDGPAENAAIFIDFITSEFDCHWLTTHCQGDSTTAVEYLAEYFPPEVIAKLKVVKPTVWRTLKTEGIDFSKPFIWLDDCPFQAEIEMLDSKGASDSLFKVNLGNRDELLGVIEFLKNGIIGQKRTCSPWKNGQKYVLLSWKSGQKYD